MTFGYDRECYKLMNGSWQKQNPLTKKRSNAVTIVMSSGVFCFGGNSSPCTSDFLPNGLNVWIAGPEVPNPGINGGHGVAISHKELLIVGGEKTNLRMLLYNIKSQKWREVGSLYQRRIGPRCFVHNGKVIITGGEYEYVFSFGKSHPQSTDPPTTVKMGLPESRCTTLDKIWTSS